jgi:hypothetical protein
MTKNGYIKEHKFPNAHKNSETSSGTERPAACFDQMCGHLQGGKVQKTDTLKSIK